LLEAKATFAPNVGLRVRDYTIAVWGNKHPRSHNSESQKNAVARVFSAEIVNFPFCDTLQQLAAEKG
jgi:hypothetical protein